MTRDGLHRKRPRSRAGKRPTAGKACASLLFAVGLTVGGMFTAVNVEAQEDGRYRLGARDKLMVRVGRWDAATGVYEGWVDVGGEYLVGPDGTVSLPLIGNIAASGLTPSELAEEISTRLQQRVGFSDELEASVEILEFRPVYVVGAVNNPGSYPFVPGLTVIQAIGLAGGIESLDGVFLRAERSALEALGNYEVSRLQLWRTLALEARLESELQDREDVPMPEALADAPMADALIETERALKEARDEAFHSSLSQIESLEALLREQIASLGEQIILRERQVELARKELEGVDKLMDKGLTVASRQSELGRTLADLEANMLENETAKLRAEQQLNEAGRDRLDLINERRREIVESLRDARSEIAALQVKLRTESALFAEASRYGTGYYRPDDTGSPTYSVIRRTERGIESLDVDRTASLIPGDVLEVQPPELPDTIEGAPLISSVPRLPSGESETPPVTSSAETPAAPSSADGAGATETAPTAGSPSMAGAPAGTEAGSTGAAMPRSSTSLADLLKRRSRAFGENTDKGSEAAPSDEEAGREGMPADAEEPGPSAAAPLPPIRSSRN